MSDDERMRAFSCTQVEELAPELGLGVLTGIDRAKALAHLEACPSCQALVEDMAEMGDSLLGLGPEVDPPPGFESRLLARREVKPQRSIQRRKWPALVGAAAAAAAMAVAGIGVGVGIGTRRGPDSQVTHPSVVSALGGRELSAAVLRHQGHKVGQVFVYAGRPSWVFMTVESDGIPRQVTCELQMKGGQTIVIGTFVISNGYGSWGSTVKVDPKRIQGVRLVDAHARTLATASV